MASPMLQQPPITDSQGATQWTSEPDKGTQGGPLATTSCRNGRWTWRDGATAKEWPAILNAKVLQIFLEVDRYYFSPEHGEKKRGDSGSVNVARDSKALLSFSSSAQCITNGALPGAFAKKKQRAPISSQVERELGYRTLGLIIQGLQGPIPHVAEADMGTCSDHSVVWQPMSGSINVP